MELNKIYEGFKLQEIKELKDINSTGMIFEHEKTGAQLFFIKNDDDNKVFSISFRTPPENSTGVPHIIEHSVLCGSRKFPVKEPFVELIKGSLNTFLNAMTFPDKTMYPVASKNDKDFLNLMDVYLDAVLYPDMYNHPEIFMQEGWHYELQKKEDPLTLKGVVYNEMKGAFSSPDSVLMRKVQESLFPDTIYGVESGGDPEVIPELSYEEFINFHKKYYHPSNSYIYLYGNMDIEEKLKFINENYLKDFDKIHVDSEIKIQKPFENTKENTVEYPISEKESEKDKTFLSLNFVMGTSKDKEEYLSLDMLENILLESESSPLKKALIEANLGKDVYGYYDRSILQPVFSIVVKNSNEDKRDAFRKMVKDCLLDLVKNGIDKKLIEACINRKEFDLKEANYQSFPKGLAYGIECMDSWLYGEDPCKHLEFESTLEKIKTALTTNYFEKLIEKYLLDNPHSSILVVKPCKGMAEAKEEETKTKLKNYKESLNEGEINKIIESTNKLMERQVTPDSKEKLELIPLLSLNDINKEIEKLPIEEKEELGVKVLHHSIFTGGIAYLTLYFDMSSVKEDLISYASLLSALLTNISTKNYSYEDLTNEIDINTGGMSFNPACYSNCNDSMTFYPKFDVRSKVLIEKMPKLFELLGEIISNTKFDEKKKAKELIQKIKSRLEMSLFDRGHMVAAKRLCSYFSPSTKYNEIINGLDFYNFICDIEKDFENKWETISSKLQEVTNLIFNKENLLISLTCDEKDYLNFKDNFKILQEKLKGNKIIDSKPKFDLKPYNEGIMTSAKVQYVAKGYNFRKAGFEYSGALRVLKTIISFDYLWNKVRVQGGAYGSFSHFEMNGNLFFTSYRDPNLKETLDAYNDAYKYVEQFNADYREMTKYIIGTISELDTPLTPSMKGDAASINYIRGISEEAIKKERDEILSTSVDDIRSLKDMLKASFEENYICVLGNESTIKENKDLFKKTFNLFE
ncbi:insulinase family protein [Haloimpatiens sp. FM7315]|uniref:insulinase family protein n=1 Tax=Haloimpatiens sp. FM7315 TaxID=3298609 RepID=UPI00397752CB